MARDEEDYNINHGDIIPIPDLSSKIINDAPSDGDMHITHRMENYIENPYTIESFYSGEEDDEDNEEGADDEEDSNDEEEVDDEENIEDEEDELATDKGEA